MRCLDGEILQWVALEKILLHKVGGDKKSLGTYGLEKYPDIVYTNLKLKKYFIIDVKCPENTEYRMKKVYKTNLEKYKCLIEAAEKFLPQKENWSAKLFTFIIGSIESWYPDNIKIFNAFKIIKGFKQESLEKCAKSCINSSFLYWKNFSKAKITQQKPFVATDWTLFWLVLLRESKNSGLFEITSRPVVEVLFPLTFDFHSFN